MSLLSIFSFVLLSFLSAQQNTVKSAIENIVVVDERGHRCILVAGRENLKIQIGKEDDYYISCLSS